MSISRGLRTQAWLGATAPLGLLALFGCQGTAPGRAVQAPDISKIAVFYPVDGMVQGRGSANTFPDPSVTHVTVRSHPTGGETVLPVEQDGSFDFEVLAYTRDVLEIAGARDSYGLDRGDVAYIRVPDAEPPRPHFFCCGDGADKTCTAEDAYKQSNHCAQAQAGATVCTTVSECWRENHELLPLRMSRVEITPPNEDGKIDITGVIDTAGALVHLENRGKAGIGGPNPGIRTARISDANGTFKFTNLKAQGDDEIVIQLRDLLGYKSPEGTALVPDAKLVGLDVVGAYPYARLANGKVGTVAVRFHPHGTDGRGICPDSNDNPVLCFTGGLTHDMVHLDEVKLDDLTIATPRPTQMNASVPSNRATEGDPLTGQQMIVLVLDHSQNAATADPGRPPLRFRAVNQLVKSLRKRDRVGIVSFGGTTKVELDIKDSGGDWSAQLAALDQLAARPAAGSSDVFGAISAAAKMLIDEKSTLGGSIIVVSLGDTAGTDTEASTAFGQAYDAVKADPETGFRGYSVYFVGVAIPQPVQTGGQTVGNLPWLQSIAEFSPGGRFVNLPGISGLGDALGDAAGYVAGSFVLLYDMAIPESVGKSAALKITATVSLPNAAGVASATGTYEGPLRIDGSEH